MTKQNCKVCGKIFEARPENIKRGWGLTCSKSCAVTIKKEASTKKVYDGIKAKFAGQVEIISPAPFTLKSEITIKCVKHGKIVTTLEKIKNRYHACPTCSKEYSYLEKVKNQHARFISATHKECVDCKKVFERSEFQHDKRGKILARCPKCNTAYQTERNWKHVAKRRVTKIKVYVEQVINTKVFERDNWKCVKCGVKVQTKHVHKANAANVDHIVPISLGGPHSYSNVQTLCGRCNKSKGNRYKGQLVLYV